MTTPHQSFNNMINPVINSKRSMAESYISSLMSRSVPYDIDILGNKFIIKDHNTYPPGNLSRMFGKFIVQSKVTEGKVVADGVYLE